MIKFFRQVYTQVGFIVENDQTEKGLNLKFSILQTDEIGRYIIKLIGEENNIDSWKNRNNAVEITESEANQLIITNPLINTNLNDSIKILKRR